jgi:hypothetical protein
MRWAVILVFLAAIFVPPAEASVDLAYQPMRADFRLIAGQTQTGVVQLKNQGTEPVHLRVRTLDFFVSGDNTPQFVAEGDESYSCRNWMIVNPVEMDIAAGAVVPVRYTMQVPGTPVASSRTYRCALGFESMPTLEDRIQKRSGNTIRLVTVVYATIGNPESVPNIGTPEILEREDLWRLDVPFSNGGETHYRLNGHVVIKDQNSKTVETFDMDSSPIHPGTLVHIGFPIKPLPQGEYTMVLQLEQGTRILEKEAIVEVLATR